MADDVYQFKIGSIECMAINDGTSDYSHPSSFLFANAPKDLLEVKLHAHQIKPEKWEKWTSPYICLLINTGKHTVLVDTGAGDLEPTTGKLVQNLESEGVSVKDIDTIIITHGHPDHLGGNTDGEGNLVFPNARFVIHGDEWDFWTGEPNLSELKIEERLRELLITYAQNNLLPLKNQIDLIGDDVDIVPGVRSIAAPGHTPGHLALSVSSEGHRLLVTSDALIHPIHVEKPDWYTVVDMDPEQVLDTRRRLLNRAMKEEALVLAFHFPFPGLGRFVQEGEGWQWQPVKTTV